MREACHQSSRVAGVNFMSITSRITNMAPRTRPNTIPSKRSVPDKPVPLTSLRIRNATIAPIINTPMKQSV